ncbi:hypothetical protein Pyn_32574 [Prunus yedoensis var. nudiflora]|uniref:Uncharacterized protein n=1 Tax=Prunus yedoensis var. nudiflora TaxID=2094558 RepID=A0A314Z306_PRUYE|nr:hypothetical protein Pyn_32574 [Prunus yedoensis var. nudiflora]
MFREEESRRQHSGRCRAVPAAMSDVPEKRSRRQHCWKVRAVPAAMSMFQKRGVGGALLEGAGQHLCRMFREEEE